MFKIYRTICTILNDRFADSTPEFKAGAAAAMRLLKLGIEKDVKFDLHVEIERLKRESKKLTREIALLRGQNVHLNLELNFKSLTAPYPTGVFKEYEIPAITGGVFKICINADRDSVATMFLIFNRYSKYKSADECKSKFLGFLKTLKEKGFLAYKDMKTARKEAPHDS